jgi:hypothetical protein
MLNSEDMEKARNIQLGLSQFENMHLPKKEGELFICGVCDVDFPCERMMLFMLMQSIAAFSAMIPTGNMGSVLARFGGKK